MANKIKFEDKDDRGRHFAEAGDSGSTVIPLKSGRDDVLTLRYPSLSNLAEIPGFKSEKVKVLQPIKKDEPDVELHKELFIDIRKEEKPTPDSNKIKTVCKPESPTGSSELCIQEDVNLLTPDTLTRLLDSGVLKSESLKWLTYNSLQCIELRDLSDNLVNTYNAGENIAVRMRSRNDSMYEDIDSGDYVWEKILKNGKFGSVELYRTRNSGYFIKKKFNKSSKKEALISSVHFNLTGVYCLIKRDNIFELILEYGGINLLTFIQQSKLLNQSEVVCLASEGFDAMAYLHSHGLKHQQITPKEIFIQNMQGKFTLKMSNTCLSEQNGSSAVIAYASPEGIFRMICDIKNPSELEIKISEKANVFEFGLVMLFMMIGKHVVEDAVRALYPSTSGTETTNKSVTAKILKEYIRSPDFAQKNCIPVSIGSQLRKVYVNILNGLPNYRPGAKEAKDLVEKLEHGKLMENDPDIPYTGYDRDHRAEYSTRQADRSGSVPMEQRTVLEKRKRYRNSSDEPSLEGEKFKNKRVCLAKHKTLVNQNVKQKIKSKIHGTGGEDENFVISKHIALEDDVDAARCSPVQVEDGNAAEEPNISKIYTNIPHFNKIINAKLI